MIIPFPFPRFAIELWILLRPVNPAKSCSGLGKRWPQNNKKGFP